MSDDMVLLIIFFPIWFPIVMTLAGGIIGILLGLLGLSVPFVFRVMTFWLLASGLFLLNSFRRLFGWPKLKYQLKWDKNKKEPLGFHPNN
jgi:hypothetical protein